MAGMKLSLPLLAAALLAGSAVSGGPGRAVGMAVLVNGEVRLKRPGAPEAVQLKSRDDLYIGDLLETGAGGSASIALLYGSEIRLNENTILEFIPGKGRRDEVNLLHGQVWTRMLHKRGGVNIRTRTAVCAIRGTEADIEQRAALTVKVYEGRVDVENEAGKVSLKAGEMTRVAGPSSAPAKASRMAPADYGRWQEPLSSPEILRFLEQLRSGGGNKKLDLSVGKTGKGEREVSIKLKKAEGE